MLPRPDREEMAVRRAKVTEAGSGKEVSIARLPLVESRTRYVMGQEFKHWRQVAARTRRFPLSVCCLPVINPLGLPYRVWLGFTNFVDLTYTAFVVSLSIAFQRAGEPAGWLAYMDIVGSAVYIADLVAGFCVGWVARWDTRALVVRDGRSTAAFYIQHGTFVADFLAALPTFVQIAAWATGYGQSYLNIILTLRLLRLYRVVRLLRNLSPGTGGGPLQRVSALLLSTHSLLLIQALFSLCVLVNLLGCIWWNVAENEGLDNAWPSSLSKNYDLVTATDPARWAVSCYFALTTITTIGYGDVTPVTIRETFITMAFQIIGVSFFGYILNVATSLLSAAGPRARRAEAVKSKLQDVEELMAPLHLSARMQRSIRLYYSELWRPEEENGDALYQLFTELPVYLRTRLTEERQRAALRTLPLVCRVPQLLQRATTHALAAASLPMRLTAGQELQAAVAALDQGNLGQFAEEFDFEGPCFYIVEDGEMQVVGAKEPTRHLSFIATATEGGGRVDLTGPAVFGMPALFSPEAVAAVPGAADDTYAAAPPPPAGPPEEAPADVGASAAGGGGGADALSAVALTTVHLWRVECRQLFEDLWRVQPASLLHLLDHHLEGDAAGSEGGGAAPPGAAPAQQAAPAAAQHGQVTGEERARLLRLRARIVAAVPDAAHDSPKVATVPAGDGELDAVAIKV